MKKRFLWLVLLLPACSITKNAPVNDGNSNQSEELAAYTRPLKIFGIGTWSHQYMILTLTDANNKYVVVKTQRDTTLKIGSVYDTK